MQKIIRRRIFPSTEQAKILDLHVQRQSSCMRIAYKRLCEGKIKSIAEKRLKEIYP